VPCLHGFSLPLRGLAVAACAKAQDESAVDSGADSVLSGLSFV